MPRLAITSNNTGHGTVELDGEDISTMVRGVELRFEAGHMPVVHLDLLVSETTTASEHASAHLVEGVYDLLVRLGWTPPKGDD